ncbi:MAG: GNAT family N-acetyltransferase [Burkholderiaceae bacterium]
MQAGTVSIAAFTSAHLTVLQRWLSKEHVRQWYSQADENLAWAAQTPSTGSQALICVAEQPVGYIRWQTVDRKTLDSVGLNHIQSGSVDVDLLVGELSYAGKRVGPHALKLLEEKLKQDPAIPLIGLTTSQSNRIAQRAFQHAGFTLNGQYSPDGFGNCFLFTRNLVRPRQASKPKRTRPGTA